MRGQKRYTTQTITKRVDHEHGEHRPKLGGSAAVCTECGSVYGDRRWIRKRSGASRPHFAAEKPLRETICPSCVQIANKIAGGYVSIKGKFFQEHRQEMVNLLKNEAKKAIEDNPLSRTVAWDESENGSLMITTTTEHLAQRFGRALEKAYDGELKFDFSHENKVARVYWERD